MTDEEIDALFFTAKTAEKLNFKNHSAEFINTIISKNPTLKEEIIEFYVNLHISIFEEYDKSFKKVQNMIDNLKTGTKLYQMRSFQQIRSNLQKELISIHNEYVEQIKNILIINNTDPVCQYLLLKSIGDSYKFVGVHIKSDILKSKIQDALESYEQAVKIAEKQIGPTDPRYLRAVLNWTAFQFVFMKIRDKPISVLFKCYQQGMQILDTVPKGQIPEFVATLDLMKRNMASWTLNEEEKKQDG